MRCVVGVDTIGAYEPAIDLLARLEFPEVEAHLVHVVEPLPIPYTCGALSPSYDFSEILSDLHKAGKHALAKAVKQARHLGIQVEEELTDGLPNQELMSRAEQLGAPLICVGASRGGMSGSLFGGSVAKGLAIGSKESILVAKSSPEGAGKLTAVFATDHSTYCNSCIARLLEMRPTGIGRVIVVSAYELKGHSRLQVGHEIVASSEDVAATVIEALERRTQQVAMQFEVAAISARSHVVEGHPNQVIQAAMDSFDADLLILGAVGHGFWDRLFLGSVALHQAIAEPYSVLVIRSGI